MGTGERPAPVLFQWLAILYQSITVLKDAAATIFLSMTIGKHIDADSFSINDGCGYTGTGSFSVVNDSLSVDNGS